MAEYLELDNGRIAYDVTGTGPLVVLSHGMGTNRRDFRCLAPILVDAGYRVANVDLRGAGESSTGWPVYTRTATAEDLIALVTHLGGPAVIIGHSFSGGAASIAAAQSPELITCVVEIAPFTRVAKLHLGALVTNRRHRTGVMRLIGVAITGRVGTWSRYLDRSAYPGAKPADWDSWFAALQADLRETGRMDVARKMGQSKPSDAAAALPNVSCPALVVMGTLDPDWPDPAAEAAAIVAALPGDNGSVALIDGAGHYPHAQFPTEVAAAVLPFLAAHVHA